jgi:ATP-dependent RNA helicase DeaD
MTMPTGTLLSSRTPSTPPEVAELTFDSLGMPEALDRAVRDLGFTTPSAIQARAIPALLAGRDIVGVAQTGTGKTAAFGLPLLAAVDPEVKAVQAIILTPTRELAMQVADAVATFARHLPGITVLPVYGGAPFLPQQRALKHGAQVVVGTPGRVIDHLERGSLVLDRVSYLVLDEADEMLRMGFAEEVEKVLERVPSGRQVALFSATMPPAIRRVAEQHLVNPVEVTVARQSSTVTTVKQTYSVVPHRHKAGALARVLAVSEADAAIVFVRTRDAAEELGSALIERGVSAAFISGDVAQSDREKIVDRLRNGAVDVLVATDVAARGLDVERIGLVVNYDVPREPETYVHRIGRTGRAGRDGVALTFVTPSEQSRLRTIERTIRASLVQVAVPSPAEVSVHRVRTMLARVPGRAQAGRLDVYREAVAAHLAENPELDATALLEAVLALAVGDEGPGQPGADDLDDALSRASLSTDRPRRDHDDAAPRRRASTHIAGGSPRWRVAVGHRDGLQPGALVGALTGEGGLTGADVGKIDIFGSFALVDIPGGLTPEVVDKLSRARVAGRPLRIRLDAGPRPGHGASRPTHGHANGPGHSTGPGHGPARGRV